MGIIVGARKGQSAKLHPETESATIHGGNGIANSEIQLVLYSLHDAEQYLFLRRGRRVETSAYLRNLPPKARAHVPLVQSANLLELEYQL